MINNKYNVLTKISKEGIIETTVENKCIDYYVRTIINTQEKQVREALISLGWTPPKEEKMDSLFRHVEAQEKRSYQLRIEEEFKHCRQCESEMTSEITDKGRFIRFECVCGYKKRIEL